MKQLPVFVVLGLFFAVPGEILNQVLARQNLAAFRHTMISYALLLLIGFAVSKGLALIFRKSTARLLHYLLFGFIGLMIEWFLLGNAPVLEPFQVITQPGMFTYWGTILLAPLLILDPDGTTLKKRFLCFFIAFSTLYLLVASLLPRAKGGIFFGFVLFAAGTAALNYFYFQYFESLVCSEQAPDQFIAGANKKPAGDLSGGQG